MTNKIRLDDLLVLRKLAESKSKAKAMIMSGVVFNKSIRLDKPGNFVKDEIELDIRLKKNRWVSRGGDKLEHALRFFNLKPKGLTVIDIGASTGGFTDVLLFHGAKKVYCVDVGFGQLNEKIRKDKRVVVLDRTNARYLSLTDIPFLADLIVCDASFIGLRTLLPAPLELTKQKAYLVSLIKPQFEVGKHLVGKNGVVKDRLLHAEVCSSICSWMNSKSYWSVIGLTQSPVIGPAGNYEFLMAAKKG